MLDSTGLPRCLARGSNTPPGLAAFTQQNNTTHAIPQSGLKEGVVYEPMNLISAPVRRPAVEKKLVLPWPGCFASIASAPILRA